MPVSRFSQLKCLVAKQFLLKKRNKAATIKELLFPLYTFFVLILLKTVMGTFSSLEIASFSQKETKMTLESLESIAFRQYCGDGECLLLYQPESEMATAITNDFSKGLSWLKTKSFSSSNEMESYYLHNPDTVFAGVEFSFTEGCGLNVSLLDHCVIDCALRLNGSRLILSHLYSWDETAMIQAGFLSIQQHLSKSIANVVGQVDFDVDIVTQSLPSKGFFIDGGVSLLGAIYFVLAFIPTAQILIVNVVAEKSEKIKESMLMMGLKESVFWGGWFISEFAFTGCVTVVVVSVGSACGLFGSSDPTVVMVIFLLFVASLITYAFMISTFFSKPKVAGGVGSSILTTIVIMYAGLRASGSTKKTMYLFSLLSPMSMAMLGEIIWNGNVNWNSVFEEVGGHRVLFLMLSILIDSLIYAMLAWYFALVLPRDVGAPRHILFCCDSLFRRSGYHKLGDDIPLLERDTEVMDPEASSSATDYSAAVEVQTSSLIKSKVGICIRALSLVFNPKKPSIFRNEGRDIGSTVAVDALNLDMFESQVFCLLGQNAAGKTSLISMLCGLISPTGGGAVVNNYHILQDMPAIRESLGCCPQSDCLCAWPSLTVREHLEIFAGIKGVSKADLADAVKRQIEAVGLTQEENKEIAELSGGMKRKLSMAIALIGDPKIIVLDEPTTGMDPASRRKIWELLSTVKHEKTILMTTHSMEEADAVSDRIGILANGCLKCVGTSESLKNRFGVGHRVTFVVDKDRNMAGMEHALTAFITSRYPTAKLSEKNTAELVYHIPNPDQLQSSSITSTSTPTTATSSSASLSSLFRDLEGEMANLGIVQFGISATTLEDVFLKISGQTLDFVNPSAAHEETEEPAAVNPNEKWEEHLQRRRCGFRGQVGAVMTSRWQQARRDRRVHINGIMMPIIMAVVAVLFSKGGFSQGRALNLDHKPSSYFGMDVFQEAGVPLQVFGTANLNPTLLSALRAAQNRTPEYMVLHEEGNVLADGMYGPGLVLGNVENTLDIQYNNSFPMSSSVILSVIVDAVLQSASTSVHIRNDAFPFHSIFPDFSPIIFVFGLVYISPYLTEAVVKDRNQHLKFMLLMNGLTPTAYWTATSIADFIFTIIPMCIVAVVGAISGSPLFRGIVGIATFISLIFFALALVPFCQLLSFGFKEAKSVLKYMQMILFFCAMGPMLVTSILSIVAPTQMPLISLLMGFLPPYTICRVLVDITEKMSAGVLLDGGKMFEVVWIAVVQQIAVAVVCIIIVAMLERRKKEACVEEQQRWNQTITAVNEDEDQDVHQERVKAETVDAIDENLLVVQHLHCVYGIDRWSECIAIKNLSFALNAGECFVCVGQNGAGKTSAMSILAGLQTASFGNVSIAGRSIATQLADVHHLMGVCEQEDRYWEFLTVTEHLQLLARIRGIAEDKISSDIAELLNELSLSEAAHQCANVLSGGTKRKLSVAMALITKPLIVLLDEPSSGMDPMSKRHLWNALLSRRKDQLVLLSTHCMDEAEALGTKIGIFVKGQLKCFGSPQHLKSTIGQCYSISCRGTDRVRLRDAKKRLLSTLGIGNDNDDNGTEEDEEEGAESFIVDVPAANVSLSQIFAMLENLKESTGLISDFMVSQTTLEQVFHRVVSNTR